MQEIITRSGERVIKSEMHKEVTQESVHKRQVMSTRIFIKKLLNLSYIKKSSEIWCTGVSKEK